MSVALSTVPSLTPDQLLAVDVAQRHMDACVVAGPGSGKTTVLVEYFRRLVEAEVDPLRILAITFTEKAASNMRKKLASAFGEEPVVRAKLERAWVSTVHGFCARLLRENAVFAGVDPEFRVLDGTESWRMQQAALRATIDALLEEKPAEMRRLIRALPDAEFEQAVLSAYDTMRGAGVEVPALSEFATPSNDAMEQVRATLARLRAEDVSGWNPKQRDYLDCVKEAAERVGSAANPVDALRAIRGFECNLSKCKRGNDAYELVRALRERIGDAQSAQITALYEPERELLLVLFARFDERYRAAKRSVSGLDFSDLEEFTVRLLSEHHEARARLRQQFEHILMDEFQDTNGQQARLMELIRPPDRFYAVGDINQSIFGFRHADPEGFQTYQNEIVTRERRLVQLLDNFRSRAEILSAVEAVTAGTPGIADRSLVAGRIFDDAPEFAVEVAAAAEGEIEAAWVARRVLELDEFAFQDIAVLVRNTEVIPLFTGAFEAAGIPYVVNRGRGFHESREVNDLTHLLRVIANPRDEISLAAVLRSPLVNVSDEALVRLKRGGRGLGGFWRVEAGEFGAEDHAKLARFAELLREWRRRREYVTFDRLLWRAIDDCGYAASPNLDKFLGLARDAAGRMSLDEFIAELEIVREEDRREMDAPPEDAANAVKIMTVHSAKGLEFPVVFVAAMHKGVNASVPVVAFSRHFGLGARWRNPASGKDAGDLFHAAVVREWAEREERESNRLLYVAMTRAEKRLVLSFTRRKSPANWDRLVIERLALDPDTPCDSVRTYSAPDGKAWKARVTVVDAAPDPLTRPSVAEEERTVLHVSAPAVTDQQNSNATVTELAAFANCPRKYFLRHYLGYEGRARGIPRDRKLSASELGTQVHALLAGSAVEEADPDARRLAAVFHHGVLGRRAGAVRTAEREFDFLMAVEDLVIRGQVDLWFEEGGELVVVDYKTDSVTAADAPGHARDYALQLRLYAMAVAQVAGRMPDRAWLHFLRPDIEVEVPLGAAVAVDVNARVREFQLAQSRLEFPMAEGERCARCEFRGGLCPAGAE
jgi:ATP-dependent helicase/nuclease subunit A